MTDGANLMKKWTQERKKGYPQPKKERKVTLYVLYPYNYWHKTRNSCNRLSARAEAVNVVETVQFLWYTQAQSKQAVSARRNATTCGKYAIAGQDTHRHSHKAHLLL